MKKIISVLLTLSLLVLSCAFAAAEETADALWYELSADGTVLTVRLPGNTKNGLDWQFEISNPDALELITQEVVEGESEGMAGAPTTYVASFMSTAAAENSVSLILHYNDGSAEADVKTNVLELTVDADNVITVASVLTIDKDIASMIELADDGYVMTVRLPYAASEDCSWQQEPGEALELLTFETEEGFVGSYMATMEYAGTAELIIDCTDADGNLIISYTVDVFVNESGEITPNWVQTFEILG